MMFQSPVPPTAFVQTEWANMYPQFYSRPEFTNLVQSSDDVGQIWAAEERPELWKEDECPPCPCKADNLHKWTDSVIQVNPPIDMEAARAWDGKLGFSLDLPHHAPVQQ